MMCPNDLDLVSIEKKYSYRLNSLAKPGDMKRSVSVKENIIRAALLKKGDGVFVLRSDRTWRFAIVLRTVLHETPQIDLILDKKGSKKYLSLKYWATNIRAFRSSTIIHSNEDQLLVFHLSRSFELVKNIKKDTPTVSGYFKKLFTPSTAKVQDSYDKQGSDESQQTWDPSVMKMSGSGKSNGSKRDECQQTPMNAKPTSRLVERKGNKLVCSCASAAIVGSVADSSTANDEIHESTSQIEVDTNHQVSALPDHSAYQNLEAERNDVTSPLDKTNLEEECKVPTSVTSTMKNLADREKFQSLFESWMKKEVKSAYNGSLNGPPDYTKNAERTVQTVPLYISVMDDDEVMSLTSEVSFCI